MTVAFPRHYPKGYPVEDYGTCKGVPKGYGISHGLFHGMSNERVNSTESYMGLAPETRHGASQGIHLVVCRWNNPWDIPSGVP